MAGIAAKNLRAISGSASAATKRMKDEDHVLLAGYGALLGLFVGDAAGAPLKHRGCVTDMDAQHAVVAMPGGGPNGVGRGQVTDSSEVSMALALGLAGHNPNKGFPTDSVADQYFAWKLTGCFDHSLALGDPFCPVLRHCDVSPGRSMRKAAAHHNAKCENNEALQRVAPLSIWAAAWRCDPSLLEDMAAQDAELTHPSSVVQECNATYAIALQHLLLHPGDVHGAIAAAEKYVTTNTACPPEVRDWLLKLSISGPPRKACNIEDTLHVRHAFCLAFHFLRNATPFEEAIFKTVCTGGYCDANAAIVGSLLGALHGAHSIPMYMQHPVLAFDSSTCRPSQPRPFTYSACRIHQFLKGLFPHRK